MQIGANWKVILTLIVVIILNRQLNYILIFVVFQVDEIQ